MGTIGNVSSKPKSSVVVVSHRPAPMLTACLESVIGQADEVLVVDNGSPNDQASQIARRVGARSLRIRRNIGFAGGANAGISQTRAEIVGLLNDDAVAGVGWLEAASALLADPTIAAVGPKVMLSGPYREVVLADDAWPEPHDSRPLVRRVTSATLGGADVLGALVGAGIARVGLRQSSAGRWHWTADHMPFYVRVGDGGGDAELCVNGKRVPPGRIVELLNSAGAYLRTDGYAGDIGDGEADDEQFDAAAERFSLSGVALVTTRAALEKVGRFEPRFFAYYEDTDWCWRARLIGLRLFYEPSVTVSHLRGTTSGGGTSRQVQHLAERNRLLTLLRNAPLTLALGETWRKRRGGGDDGVAEVLARATPRALVDRAILRRSWALTPREVFDRWAGVDAPAAAR
jgi:GT2 family glycosyltransferase